MLFLHLLLSFSDVRLMLSVREISTFTKVTFEDTKWAHLKGIWCAKQSGCSVDTWTGTKNQICNREQIKILVQVHSIQIFCWDCLYCKVTLPLGLCSCCCDNGLKCSKKTLMWSCTFSCTGFLIEISSSRVRNDPAVKAYYRHSLFAKESQSILGFSTNLRECILLS